MRAKSGQLLVLSVIRVVLLLEQPRAIGDAEEQRCTQHNNV